MYLNQTLILFISKVEREGNSCSLQAVREIEINLFSHQHLYSFVLQNKLPKSSVNASNYRRQCRFICSQKATQNRCVRARVYTHTLTRTMQIRLQRYYKYFVRPNIFPKKCEKMRNNNKYLKFSQNLNKS